MSPRSWPSGRPADLEAPSAAPVMTPIAVAIPDDPEAAIARLEPDLRTARTDCNSSRQLTVVTPSDPAPDATLSAFQRCASREPNFQFLALAPRPESLPHGCVAQAPSTKKCCRALAATSVRR